MRQLEQAFEPYRRMFEEMRGKKSSSHQCFRKGKKKTLKILKHCVFFWGGEGQLFADFYLSREGVLGT